MFSETTSGLSYLIAILAVVLSGRIGWTFGLRSSAVRLKALKDELARKADDRNKEIARREDLIASQLNTLREDGALLPSLVRWSNRLQSAVDEGDRQSLLRKSRPAPSAAEKVREANQKARHFKEISETLENRVDLYESIAPWLIEYTELTVGEVLEGLRESTLETSGEDIPALKYLSKTEWETLDEGQRLQKALDNYLNPARRRTPWQVGIDFERYVGYTYEVNGYRVTFHGAKLGLDDLGIDLICEKDDEILIIQCKRLSSIKKIPVRENTIAQLYGASQFYRLKKKIPKNKSIEPVLVTSYELSDQAREFANHLGVQLKENVLIAPYPTIKCNINPSTGERIFHLPFDQQYDNVVIGDVDGEMYASSVDEAFKRGFRHAYRWTGSRA